MATVEQINEAVTLFVGDSARINEMLLSDENTDVTMSDDTTRRSIAKQVKERTDELVAATFGYDSVAYLALLRSYTSADFSYLATAGYAAAGDGGGNSFYYNAASTATDNAATIIKPTAVSGAGRWIAINGKSSTPEQWGCDGSGASDCTARLNAMGVYAVANGMAIVGTAGATYLFNTADVNLRKVACNFLDSTITVAGGYKLIIGGDASSGDNKEQKFGYIQRQGGATATPTVRVIGAKTQKISVRRVDYLQVYADTAAAVYSTDYSSAYSTFNFDYCNKLELNNNPANVGTGGGADSTTQWINENTFNLKRTNIILIDGNYAHNNNIFNAGCLEGSSSITINKGYSNLFRDLRFEGGSTITFAAGTWSNQVIQLWANSRRNDYDNVAGQAVITVNDSGVGNTVIQNAHTLQQRIPLLSVNTSNCLTFSYVGGATNFARSPNFTTLANVDLQRYGIDRFTRNNNRLVFDSPLIPVSIGDCIQFEASHALFRSHVRLYDANKVLITSEIVSANPANYLFMQGDSGLTWDGVDRYKFSTDSAGHKGIIVGAVAYIKWDIMSGGASVGLPFDWLTLSLLTYKRGAANYKSLCQAPKEAASTASPVIGFASEIGTVVNKTGANGQYNAVMALDTTLSVAAVGGDATVTLTSVTGLQNLDIIGILLDTGQAHWTTVNGAPVGNVVTLTVVMPSGAAIGKRVVANRWL